MEETAICWRNEENVFVLHPGVIWTKELHVLVLFEANVAFSLHLAFYSTGLSFAPVA